MEVGCKALHFSMKAWHTTNRVVGNCVSCVWNCITDKTALLQWIHQEGEEMEEVYHFAVWIHTEGSLQVLIFLLHISPHVTYTGGKCDPIVCLHNDFQHSCLCWYFMLRCKPFWSTLIFSYRLSIPTLMYESSFSVTKLLMPLHCFHEVTV